MADVKPEYSSWTARMLYDSPLHSWLGKILFFLIVGVAAVMAGKVWFDWLSSPARIPIFALGTLVVIVGSIPVYLVMLFLDRRDPEPWWYFFVFVLFAFLIAGPPAAMVNGWSPYSTLTVGFNEEFWKVLPLLLLVFFAPTVVNGVRDGIIYGGLGGFAFNMMELADYMIHDIDRFPLTEVLNTQVSRLGFFGFDHHVIWSMVVGGGIGYAVFAKGHKFRFVVPVVAYLGAVFTHTLQDNLVGALLLIGLTMAIAVVAGIDTASLNANPADTAAAAKAFAPYLQTASGLEVLLLNLFNIGFIFYGLFKSGDWERRIIREQLSSEPADIVSADDMAGIEAETRYHLRQIIKMPHRAAKEIRNIQNAIAFLKQYLDRRGKNIEEDPLIQYYRQKVRGLRNSNSGDIVGFEN